jgi:O-antigen/teichoic acid export membrane protein
MVSILHAEASSGMTVKFPQGLLKDELLRHGGVMFIASIIANALNYVYQVYMGRALGPEQYGIFGALFAIFYMIGIISQTLSTSATSFVSKLTAEGREIASFLLGAIKRVALIGLTFSLLFLAASRSIASVLKIPSVEPVVVLAFILFLAWVMPINIGMLRGLKRFFALGMLTVSSAFFKLISGVALVALGYGVTGALLGVAVGTLAALLISFFLIAPYLKQSSHESSFNFSAFYSYSAPVMLAMFCFSVPANLDVVLAKYFFSAREAGFYTSASVLGKIIFFFPSAIYTVMFPMIAERHARGEDTFQVLKKSLAYAGLLSGSLVAAYLLFPQLVVILFGSSYLEALPLVAPYGLAMLFFSLSVILLNYHLAIRNMRYVTLFAGFTFLEIFLLLTFHSSPLELAEVLLSVNFALLTASMVYTLR